MKQLVYFQYKLYRHVQELFQGVAEVFSIEFNDDLIKELEGIFKGLHEHLPLTSIKGLIKKCTRNQPKELQEHHPLIFNDDLIRNLTRICPGSIWSMPPHILTKVLKQNVKELTKETATTCSIDFQFGF